jgi:hypothetical protein
MSGLGLWSGVLKNMSGLVVESRQCNVSLRRAARLSDLVCSLILFCIKAWKVRKCMLRAGKVQPDMYLKYV